MTITVAAAQLNPTIGDIPGNLQRAEHVMEEAAQRGAGLVVLPECALTGYVFSALEEALPYGQSVPGPATDRLEAVARRLGVHAIFGMLEKVGDRLYNTAVFVGPEGLIAKYRKTHLLYLGVDRFTTPGDIPFAVHDTPLGRIGILICYDLRFPEPARVLALQGAQIITLPTNWPVGADIQPDVLTRARATENHVFLVAADRVGIERGGTFIGRSQIVAPFGRLLTEASATEVEIITAEIEPERATNKHIVNRPGEYEMDYFADRRPELYEAVFEGHRQGRKV
ncbi:MAG TPA: carbon-nitrogen hydrolase family protein [Chloroflexota bacterium]